LKLADWSVILKQEVWRCKGKASDVAYLIWPKVSQWSIHVLPTGRVTPSMIWLFSERKRSSILFGDCPAAILFSLMGACSTRGLSGREG
jgi:hypothetical protein